MARKIGEEQLQDAPVKQLDFEELAPRHRKRKSGRGRMGMFLALLLVFTALMLFLFRNDLNLYGVRRLLSAVNITLPGENAIHTTVDFAFDSAQTNQYASYQGDIAILSSTGLKLYDYQGDELYSMQTVYTRPALQTTSKYMLLYDRGGKELTVTNGVSVVFTQSYAYPITCARMNENGYLAVVTGDQDSKSLVTVYNERFEVVYRFYSRENYVLDVDLRGDSRGMAVAAFCSVNGEIAARVMTFLFEKQEPVSNLLQENAMPLSVRYKDDGRITLLCDSSMLFLNAAGELAGEYSFDGDNLQLFSQSPSNGTVVVLNEHLVGNDCRVVKLDSTGKEIFNMETKEEYSYLEADETNIVLLSPEKVHLISADGSPKGTVTVDKETGSALLDDTGNCILFGLNRAYMLTVH